MEESEKKLSNDNDRFRSGDRTWDMTGGRAAQRFEHEDKSVQSDSTAERLRAPGKETRKPGKKPEKPGRNRRTARRVHAGGGSGHAADRLKERSGRGRLYSRNHSRLLKRTNPGPDPAGTGPVPGVAARKDLRKANAQQRRQENRNHARRRLLFREAEKALGNGAGEEDASTQDSLTDSLMRDGMETGRKGGRLLHRGVRRASDRLQESRGGNTGRNHAAGLPRNKGERRLYEERHRLSERQGDPEQHGNPVGKGSAVYSGWEKDGPGRGGGRRSSPSAASQAYKKRVKKQQVAEHHRQSQKSFLKRSSGFLHKARKARERAVRTRHTLAILFSGAGAVLLAAGAALILLYAVLALISAGTSTGAAFISMNDYGTMTEATNYFNDKCTSLYMYLNIDRDKNIEPELKKELDTDIYEFIYDVDRPITYGQIDLIAYLSAKYGSFTLDMVKEELDDIFAEMFKVEAEIKAEPREVTDPSTGEKTNVNKNICYVTLRTTGFDDVTGDRLTDGQQNSYLGYQLSGCGQQVMNPVMEEDWTDLVSSPFGSRYHPIHKEYRMHNGVDIAVPTGTKVYAAVSGEVTAARYSESAGYMVSITDENGFTVTYMHLSSYAVAAGQKISAGQMVALSGNTGNSTGPHLHLAVQDADGNYLNPIFMIPQTCVTVNQ